MCTVIIANYNRLLSLYRLKDLRTSKYTMKQLAFIAFWVHHFILDDGDPQFSNDLSNVRRRISKFHNYDLVTWLEDRRVFLPNDAMRKVCHKSFILICPGPSSLAII